MAIDPHRYDVPLKPPREPHLPGQRCDDQELIRVEGRVEMWQTANDRYTVWLHDFEKYLLHNRRAKKANADELFDRVLRLTSS